MPPVNAGNWAQGSAVGRKERRFANRADAGRRLGEALKAYSGRSDVTVLGLPRGGVPVAAEVASRLGAPLDAFVVRKLGFPGHEELAMGAVASGGLRVLNRDVLRSGGVDDEQVEAETRKQWLEVEAREKAYRLGRAPLPVEGRVVILVDDGLATGASLRAAIQAVRQARPARIVAAVPVASREGLEAANREADEVVCLMVPADFMAVGQWYDDFRQVSDEEVRAYLEGRADRS
jgi:putative phosphoribosyl transferase